MDPMKFEKDIDWAMRSTRLLLSPLGLWPTKSKVYRKLVRPVALALCLFAMLFVTIPLCLFVILVAKDLKIRLKLIGSLSFGLMSLCKYAVMIYKEGTMAECICSMSLDWRALRDAAEYKIMTSNAKTGRLLVVACVIFVYGGGMPCVAVLPLFERSTLLVNESLRPLPYPSYFVLFDPQVRPIYDFVFALHCICGFVKYTISCGVYSITILCIMHICSQITIARNLLDKLVENFDCQLLGEAVSQHQRSLK